ncbi:VanZ family protein [Arthrobacter citreus]|uniref:VanZ family protein n=1 Tax=Arthrobacter TaxID=1663 RepID=UPI0014782351|nr:VanZ family protein [Arthrobacter gandavensis]
MAAPRALPGRPRPRPRRGYLALLFLLYLGTLALIVVWPSPVDRDSAHVLEAVLRRLQGIGAPGWIDYAFIENLANILLFIPFGLLGAAWLSEHRIWWAAVWGIAASCVVESAQAVLLPSRFATIYDVTANSLGAALGCLAIYAWRSRQRGSKGNSDS